MVRAYLLRGRMLLAAAVACTPPAAAQAPVPVPVPVPVPTVGPENALMCKAPPKPATFAPRWNGWSPTLDNARLAVGGGLKARDVAKLKVKWAFAFTGGVGSQPSVIGDRLYFGTGAGRVYALDTKSGCAFWQAEIKNGVRAAVVVGPLAGPSARGGRLAAFVADRKGEVHALDALTGRKIWSAKVDTHQFATITGSPVLYRGRLYVPLSSQEELSTFVSGYQCCTFRGSVAALDSANGKLLWRTFTILEEAKAYRNAPDGSPIFGPAGAAIWSAPTIDAQRGVLYVGTGNSYSDAPNAGANAIIAMDLVTGHLRWSRQITVGDNYLLGCSGLSGQPAVCPRTVGPDHDFGASPILRDLPDGRSILLAGQKSGEVIAVDPDRQGETAWRAKLGYGGSLGGVEWGMAAGKGMLFVPIADPLAPKGEGKGGLYALRIGDGSLAWSNPTPEPDCAIAPKGSMINICTSGLSAAATAIDGAVFEGSMDGVLRAYDARSGRVIWSFDVGQTQFHPVNSATPVKGDTMNGAGATVAGGRLFQISGYKTGNARTANLLVAFSPDGR